MFFKNEECKITQCDPGVTRKVLAYEKDMMLCEITFEKDAVGQLHTHPHVQCSYILEGSFLFTVGDEKQLVKAGDSLYIPSGVTHGVSCVESGKLLDIFTPMRDEFV